MYGNGYERTSYKGQTLTAEQFKGMWVVRWTEGGRCQSSEGWKSSGSGFKHAKTQIDKYLKAQAAQRVY